MTLRLGFVGCGKWARKLAESFRACGAEVVAYDRGAPALPKQDGLITESLRGFGYRVPWREQLAATNIDAIVAVAPPETTTEIALAAAEAGKAVLATKPLFDHPATIRSVFYVDLYRLWSEAHAYAHRGKNTFQLSGAGPVRDFPGAYDYGPHAIAAFLDRVHPGLLGATHIMQATKRPSATGELFDVALCVPDILSAEVTFGNGDTRGVREVWGEVETATHIGSESKDAVIQKMCKAFIADVQESYVDTRLLDLSRESMRLLRQIREMAK